MKKSPDSMRKDLKKDFWSLQGLANDINYAENFQSHKSLKKTLLQMSPRIVEVNLDFKYQDHQDNHLIQSSELSQRKEHDHEKGIYGNLQKVRRSLFDKLQDLIINTRNSENLSPIPDENCPNFEQSRFFDNLSLSNSLQLRLSNDLNGNNKWNSAGQSFVDDNEKAAIKIQRTIRKYLKSKSVNFRRTKISDFINRAKSVERYRIKHLTQENTTEAYIRPQENDLTSSEYQHLPCDLRSAYKKIYYLQIENEKLSKKLEKIESEVESRVNKEIVQEKAKFLKIIEKYHNLIETLKQEKMEIAEKAQKLISNENKKYTQKYEDGTIISNKNQLNESFKRIPGVTNVDNLLSAENFEIRAINRSPEIIQLEKLLDQKSLIESEPIGSKEKQYVIKFL